MGYSVYLLFESIGLIEQTIITWSAQGLFWFLILFCTALFILFIPVEFLNTYKIFNSTFKDLILNKMDKTVLPGIKENVVSDFYLTPDYFEIDLATLYGSGFSIQPKFSQSAYFRFHNQSEIYKNLYFVGAGTHPGAGMPGVLSSAKVLDKLF